MKPSLKSLAALALCCGALVVFSGCADDAFGPADAASDPLVSADQQAAPDAEAVRLEARLQATAADPLASGTAKFERRDNGRRKFSTEVEDVSVDGTGQVRVYRNGQAYFSAPIQITNGFGDLNLDTLNGQQVPGMRAGDGVGVFNADGVLILRGRLQRI